MNDAVKHIELDEPELVETGMKVSDFNLDLVKDVETVVDVKIGTITMTIGELFSLKDGAVIALDQKVDEPLQLIFNGEIIASGELVAVGENFGLKIVQINK